MIKEYIYINDKADYNNLDEILLKEQLIEQIKLEHKKIIKEKKYNKNISFKILTKSVCILLSIPIFLIILPLIFGITDLSTIPVLGIILGTTIPTYLGLFLIHEYNKINNINRGLNNQILFLQEQLILEQQHLQELKENQIKKDDISFLSNSKTVDDIVELKKLKEQLILYYNCGYYHDKYQKYLKHGNLKIKLLKYYTNEQLELVENYLNNQDKILNKK